MEAQHRARGRDLPRQRRQLAAAYQGAEDAGDRPEGAGGRRDRRHLRQARRGRGDGGHAGIRDILIANQIVGPAKMRRLVDLLRDRRSPSSASTAPRMSTSSAAALHEHGPHTACRDRGRYRHAPLPALQPGAPVVALARAIAAQPGLRFVGVMGWESHTVTIADRPRSARVVAAAIGLLTSNRRACRAAGLPVEIVSCGGTGTFLIARGSRASPRSRPAAASSATCTTAHTIGWISRRHSPC